MRCEVGTVVLIHMHIYGVIQLPHQLLNSCQQSWLHGTHQTPLIFGNYLPINNVSYSSRPESSHFRILLQIWKEEHQAFHVTP